MKTSTEASVTFWSFCAASWNVEPAGSTITLTVGALGCSTRAHDSGLPTGWLVICWV